MSTPISGPRRGVRFRYEFDVLGVPFSTRGRRTTEYLAAMRAIWTADNVVDFDGEFISFSSIHVGPRPYQRPHPPILLGGNSAGALARIVAVGDGWLGYGLSLAQVDDTDRSTAVIKHIVTVTFREDPDPEIVRSFLEMAPGALARGPFRSVVHASGVRTLSNGADWGFIADVESEDDVHAWVACDAHNEMVSYVRQISSGGTNMQMVDPIGVPDPAVKSAS